MQELETMAAAKKKMVNCMGCRYHQITWDKAFPYSCRFWGFKGKHMPCYTVVQATGQACDQFKKILRK